MTPTPVKIAEILPFPPVGLGGLASRRLAGRKSDSPLVSASNSPLFRCLVIRKCQLVTPTGHAPYPSCWQLSYCSDSSSHHCRGERSNSANRGSLRLGRIQIPADPESGGRPALARCGNVRCLSVGGGGALRGRSMGHCRISRRGGRLPAGHCRTTRLPGGRTDRLPGWRGPRARSDL